MSAEPETYFRLRMTGGAGPRPGDDYREFARWRHAADLDGARYMSLAGAKSARGHARRRAGTYADRLVIEQSAVVFDWRPVNG